MATTYYLRTTPSAVCSSSYVHQLSATKGSTSGGTVDASAAFNSSTALTVQLIPSVANNSTAATPSANVHSQGYLLDGSVPGVYPIGTWTVQVEIGDSVAAVGNTESFTAYVFVVTVSGSTVNKVSLVGNATSATWSDTSSPTARTLTFNTSVATVLNSNQYLYLELYGTDSGTGTGQLGSYINYTYSLYADDSSSSASSLTTPTFKPSSVATDTIPYPVAPPAPTFVNSTIGHQANTSSSPYISITLNGPPTVGNFLVAFFNWGANGTITPPSGWVTLYSTHGGNINNWVFYKFYTPADATGVWTLTVAANSVHWGILEFSGVCNSIPINASAQAVMTSAGETPVVSPSVTPASPWLNCLPLAQLYTFASATFSNLTSGWTIDASNSGSAAGSSAWCVGPATTDDTTPQSCTGTPSTTGTIKGYLVTLLLNPVSPPGDGAGEMVSLPRSLSDTLAALSDLLARIVSLPRTASDNFSSSFSDFAATPQCLFATATDTLSSLSDTATRALQSFLRTSAETFPVISESPVRSPQAFARAGSDSPAAPSDSAVRYTGRYPAPTDTLGAPSDSATRALKLYGLASDTLASISDAVTRIAQTFVRNGSDTLAALSDAVTRGLATHPYTTDMLGAVSDSAARAAQAFRRTGLDIINALSESAFVGHIISRTASDMLDALADSAGKAVGMPRTAADTLAAMSDSVVRLLALTRAVDDTLAALSSVAMRAVFLAPRVPTDSLAPLSDSAARMVALRHTASDALGAITDLAAAARTLGRRAADSLFATFSDIASRYNQWIRQASDTLGQITETLVVPRILRVLATDTFPAFVDFASPFKYIIVSAVDNLPAVTTQLTLLGASVLEVYNYVAGCGTSIIQLLQRVHGVDDAPPRTCSCDPDDADLTPPPT